MSRQLINEYRSELDRIVKVGGSLNEGTVRDAFQSLLKSWGRSKDLTYLSEHKMTGSGGNIYVDGALVYDIRVPFGYWEAKDSKDDLDAEILSKEAKGYPRSNIIYEDTRRAVLIQDRNRVLEADMSDTDALYDLLTKFFGYEQEAIRDFRKAIAKFAEDLPAVLEALREIIANKREGSPEYADAEVAFLKQVKETINPALDRADVTEMLIQHILTEDIFNRVFDLRDYHRDNNIAKQLYALERVLFEGYGSKRDLLAALRPYYTGIEDTAHLIQSHSEKQNFLKSLYENFYKVYNPKAADRLGVVYTPGEIVRFMIRSADWLCEKHFGKNLVDPGVEILDPATGTGTYIVELLEYFRGQPEKLRHKYKEELHANEVAILPYYVANLNIEATYQAITGQFAEFEGLCLVDTLDNVDGLGIHQGHQFDMLGAMSDENIARVRKQNSNKISVIIGNPPYNANQQNYNDENANRKYPDVDRRIKSSYIENSKAKKTKMYDMYVRFFRWAFDRLPEDGIVAFITNRSFIDTDTADGFRLAAAEEFSDLYVVDLGGDYKKKGLAGGENVFGIGTGVTVSFWIKKAKKQKARIRYAVAPVRLRDEKTSWIGNASISDIEFTLIKPDSEGYWIDHPEDEYGAELRLLDENADKKQPNQLRSIFRTYTLGISTNRDPWLYDRSRDILKSKARLLKKNFDDAPFSPKSWPKNVKWSETLRRRKKSGKSERFSSSLVKEVHYRPFARRFVYLSKFFVDRPGQSRTLFKNNFANRSLIISDPGFRAEYCVCGTDTPIDLHFGTSYDGYQQVPRYILDSESEEIDNITDWALNKFTKHYGKKAAITKDAIFAYCYAVLHDPVYREKYALNLKREFPRIPFYPDFAQWVEWGETLLDLHIDYEEVEPYPLERVDTPNPKRAEGSNPKPKLKSVLAEGAETGSVVVDEDTQITGIPAGAWDYRLGNRSAIDWVLDQHKEKKPRDPTIREKFNTYRFAEYKESMIELLAKVVRVSVDTNAITNAMKALNRNEWGD